jgi:hypothetical protein
MKATKLGIIGNMHGERKLKSPAANAIGIPIVVISLPIALESPIELWVVDMSVVGEEEEVEDELVIMGPAADANTGETFKSASSTKAFVLADTGLN